MHNINHNLLIIYIFFDLQNLQLYSYKATKVANCQGMTLFSTEASLAPQKKSSKTNMSCFTKKTMFFELN